MGSCVLTTSTLRQPTCTSQIDFMRVAPQENNVGDTAEVSEEDDVTDNFDGHGDLGQV